MAGTGPYSNNSSVVGMAPETVRGTAAALPLLWIPTKSPKIQPTITQVVNDSLMGSMVTAVDQIITARHDEYSFTCLAFVDTLPALMRGLLGGTDTVTGGAAPYTHAISLLNNDVVNGNQPPSYTFFDWDGYILRTMAGGQIDEVSLKFTATGLVEITVKVLTMPYVAAGGAPTSAFTTVAAAPSWSCATLFNAVSNTPIVEGTLSFKRGVKAVHTLGTVAPYRLYAGPLDVSGSSLTVINQSDIEQNLALAGTAFPLSLTFTPPANPTLSFKFAMSTVKASQTHQERGGDGMVITQLDLLPLPNVTDAASGGVSPVKFTGMTAQALPY